MINKLPIIIRVSLGILFIIIGIAGLILPILQGWIFLLLGFSFLGYGPSKKLLKKSRRKK